MVAQDAHDPHGNDPHAHAIHAHAAPTQLIRNTSSVWTTKVIGLPVLLLALTAVLSACLLSLLIAYTWSGRRGFPVIGEIKPETYLSLLTMHGTIMYFFVLTTAPQGGFGKLLSTHPDRRAGHGISLLNMLSFWTTLSRSCNSPLLLVMEALP